MNKKFNVAKQTYSSERIIHNSCLSCGDQIQHPLCPECIAKGFKQWLKKWPSSKEGAPGGVPNETEEIENKLNTFLKAHKNFDGKSKKCAACKNNNTHICPYCFTEYLYKLIKEAGIGVQAMSEFLFLFNFDFEHNGYSQDLEALGGY